MILTNVASAGTQIYAISITITTGHLGFLAGYMQAIAVVQHTVEALLWGVSQLYWVCESLISQRNLPIVIRNQDLAGAYNH